MTRKIKQLVAVRDTEFCEGIYAVVCEDGTLWQRLYKCESEGTGPATNIRAEWEFIPGPPAYGCKST